MDNILGIKFREYGQVYYFLAGESEVVPGDKVIVETDQGQGIGDVITLRDSLPADAGSEELRPILRKATEEDIELAISNEALGREATAYCKECIAARGLDMKLVDVEVFFDLSKFIFYFTAPSRIDFRELVKDLVKHYRTRIELRQIGVRHETQMVGAVGNCGMVCCCRRFLRKFAPVTIKMAKEQNLFLNPAKISGICGRLLCCLSYEQENYEEFHRRCPRLGKKYFTNRGPIKVLRANMFRNSLMAFSDTGEELEITLEEWQEMEARRPDQAQQPRSSRRGERAVDGEAPRERHEHRGDAAQAGNAPGKGDATRSAEDTHAGGEVLASIEAGPEDLVEVLAPVAGAGAEAGVLPSAAPSTAPVAAPSAAISATESPLEQPAPEGEQPASAQPAEAAASAEPLANQAPAAIAMPRRQIKSTDASALRSSRGRRKRKRRSRDSGSGHGQSDE